MNVTRITDFKTLARIISLVENEAGNFEETLRSLQPAEIPVIGFTGPPGAGKSTLLNTLNRLQLEAGYPTMDSNILDWISTAQCGKLIEETKELYTWIVKTSVNRRKISDAKTC